MTNQKIECIWCSSKKEFNKFIRDVDRKSTRVVDHISIKNKLMKADPYLGEPSDSIIGLTIMSDIKRFLYNKTKNHTKLIYLFNNLDQETVENFIRYIEGVSESTIEISLVIIDRDDYPKTGVLNQFNSVKFISYD